MICSDCPKTLSRTNKSGRCRSCSARWMGSNPEIRAKCAANRDAYFSRPEVKQELRERLARFMASMPDKERQRRADVAKATVAERLHTPAAKERALQRRLSPEIQKRRAKTMTRTRLPWCPDDLLPVYRELTRKGLLAAEARAAMQEMIPGTVEHARRQIANITIAQKLRAEREQAQEY